MTAAGTSVNRAAAIAVCARARDVEDARLLLDMLGLVVDGDLVPDLVTVVAAAAVQNNGRAPVTVREPPPRRDTVPEGLRNLPPAPAPPARKRHYSLTEDLEELERTDPAVAAAAASYDRMVERITRKPLPEPKDAPMPAAPPAEKTPILSLHIQESYTADDLVKLAAGRKPAAPPPDLLARGLEHPSARVRKLARAASAAVDELVTALGATR